MAQITPKGTNESNSFTSYYERILYRDHLYPRPPLLPIPIDFWYEKPFYGKMDTKGEAVFVKDTFVKKIDTIENEIFALDFVADAFRDLKSYYSIAANTNKLIIPDSNLVTLNVASGWRSTNVQHVSYVSSLFDSFNKFYMAPYDRKKKLLNFQTFLKLFMNFIKLSAGTYPFTKTGFIMSRWCDPANSGLVLEIATSNFGDDAAKYNDYINDVNYIFYAFAAEKYGFKVDKNAPWRLVADLGSPVMKKYMENYPEAPQVNLPKQMPFYYGDIVSVLSLENDPTIQGDEGISRAIEISNINFRVTNVVEESGQALRLILSPVEQPKGDIDVTTGVLYNRLQTEGILVDLKDPYNEVIIVYQGQGRDEFRSNLSNYSKSIEDYLETPKLDINNIFERRYYKSYKYDVDSLKAYVMQFYNSYVTQNPQFVLKGGSSSSKATTITRTIYRNPISLSELENQYQEDFWLNMYAEIRAIEIGWKPSPYEYASFLKKVKTIYKVNGNNSALEFINNTFTGAFKPKIMLTPPNKNATIFNVEGLETLYDGDLEI